MEMNSDFRSSEVHVAHKSRRDKLRVQQHPRLNNPSHHGLPSYNDEAHNLQQHIHGDDRGSSGLNFIRYGPPQPCSDMDASSFPVNSRAPPSSSSLLCKESENKRVAVLDPTFDHFSGSVPNHGDPQGPHHHFSSSTWRSIGPQSSRSIVGDSNWLTNSQSQIFPHGSSSPLGIMNSSSSAPMDVSGVQSMQCDALEILASAPSSNNGRSFGLGVEAFDKPAETCSGDRAGPRQVNWILGPPYADGSNQWNPSAQALCLTLSSSTAPLLHKVHSTNTADQESSPVVNISQQLNNPGPLGPFTGYATILESSKFLRPTKQLLDEICCIACPMNLETSCNNMSDPRMFEESSVSNDAEIAGDACGSFGADKSRGPLDCYGLENRRKKDTLICMQEEVSKRYKHYHQQMQMVLSSFESVSALSAATPYISLALKTVSKHFRSLKTAIANKLKTLKNTLGEDHSSSSAPPKGHQFPGSSSSSMLKFHEHGFQRTKTAGITENQHVWRPQRGLPEHAVSVLRAWLFDHFLHPYPTDTDKHMLAAQTGLTRNQVSNWFINARVRVWKPMVEEVHMLETEAMSEPGRSNNNPGRPNELLHSVPDASRNSSNPNNRSSTNPPLNDDNAWKSLEKRSRTEYDNNHYHHHHHQRNQQAANFDFDGSVLASVVPTSSHHHHHHGHSGLDMGGLGSVSLTLGLRQSAENGQQRHLEHHRMRPFS